MKYLYRAGFILAISCFSYSAEVSSVTDSQNLSAQLNWYHSYLSAEQPSSSGNIELTLPVYQQLNWQTPSSSLSDVSGLLQPRLAFESERVELAVTPNELEFIAQLPISVTPQFWVGYQAQRPQTMVTVFDLVDSASPLHLEARLPQNLTFYSDLRLGDTALETRFSAAGFNAAIDSRFLLAGYEQAKRPLKLTGQLGATVGLAQIDTQIEHFQLSARYQTVSFHWDFYRAEVDSEGKALNETDNFRILGELNGHINVQSAELQWRPTGWQIDGGLVLVTGSGDARYKVRYALLSFDEDSRVLEDARLLMARIGFQREMSVGPWRVQGRLSQWLPVESEINWLSEDEAEPAENDGSSGQTGAASTETTTDRSYQWGDGLAWRLNLSYLF